MSAMLPYSLPFPRHSTRATILLEGLWDFAWLGEDLDLDNLDVASIDFDQTMPVPSAMDAYPNMAGKRGTCAYRTGVAIPAGMSARLRFHGTGMWNRIVVDGQTLSEVSLPYSGFWVDVPPADFPQREIVVINDNRFCDERKPLQKFYFDFYAYGGLFRSVECHLYRKYIIERAAITATPEGGKAVISFHGDVPDSVELTVAIDGRPPRSITARPSGGKCEIELDTTGLEPWSPSSPALHILRIATDDDDIVERFGVRSVRAEGENILINGSPVKLKGFCRHESHPQFGPALPLQQLVQDIQILKDMGVNFVRGAHYPQDQRFLDLCDEAGLLVFEESLAWQAKEAHFQDSSFCDAQEEQTRLMVRNSINHPCVILWGFFNECASHTEASSEIYPRLVNAIRDEDPSRLVTFASNHPKDERHYCLVDVVAVNCYPGWYDWMPGMTLEESVGPLLEQLVSDIESREGGRDKPLIVSEIGAGAIWGWRDPHHGHWSEEFQANLLEEALRTILSSPRFAGVAIWQFCDCRTFSGVPRACSRPRTFNNKGVLDEYRRPKMAVSIVRKHFVGSGACEE